MTPKTRAQNLALWGAALAAATVLAFLKGIAAHWPEDGGIDWRGVWLDTIGAVLTFSPLVLAGLGLPTLGREPIAALVHEVGPGPAKAALEVEALKQSSGIADALTPAQIDQLRASLVTPLADELHGDVIDAIEARMRGTPAPDDERAAEQADGERG